MNNLDNIDKELNIRSIDRCSIIINKLLQIWLQQPDLRLFQLLCYIIPDYDRLDKFYLEDTKLEKYLDDFINNIN